MIFGPKASPLIVTVACCCFPFFAAADLGDDDYSLLVELRRHITEGRAAEAIGELQRLAAQDPDDADVQNLLGFGYRRLGNIGLARQHYDRALRLYPKHRGALEYLGELELEQGNVTAATRLLATLETICPAGCDELDDLRNALDQRGAAD